MNWQIKKLGEVCEIIGGSQPSKDNFSNVCHDGYVRLIQVRDYRTDKFATYIPKDMANRFCITTDIMIGRYGPPIFGIFRGLEGAYNVALMKAVPNESIVDKQYFYWFLKTDKLLQYVEKSSARAAGQSGVRKELLYEYPIPTPPLPEQKRIVAILDEAFAAIDKARANAEKNLANAREVFDSYLNSVFSSKGVGWKEKKLGECFKLKSGDNITSKMMIENGKFPVYGGNGIAGMYNKFNLSGSNVIIGRVGALCGNVRHIKESVWLTDNGFKITDCKYNFDHAFLKYLLNFKNLRNYARQAAQPVISNSSLEEVSLEFPKAIDEQKQIVTKLDKLSAQTKHLEEIYKHKIADLDELKKSILQKAFEGEL
jgi:type I restriction enzyme, S subunit